MNEKEKYDAAVADFESFLTTIASKTVPAILRAGAETYEERNAMYGNSYKTHGNIMAAYFPDGLKLETPEQFARYSIFSMILGKMNRYSANFLNGGHLDSIHDIVVYAAMLEELTEEKLSG